MPMSRLAAAAIDWVALQKQDAVDELMRYAETDVLCYRSGDSSELRQRQQQEWDPVLQWSREKLGVNLVVTEGIMPIPQPEEALVRVRQYLEGQDEFTLSALTLLASQTSSLILPLAIKEAALNAESAIRKSQLEEDFQSEQWGVEEAKQQRLQRAAESIRQAAQFLALLN